MHFNHVVSVHLFAAWAGFVCGVLSGAAIGLFFHKEDWLGGYSSYPRRLLRLGHISFFGLGLLNALFAATVAFVPFNELTVGVASLGLLIGTITMPLCCFASAWRKPLRVLFPIPVVSVLIGTVLVTIAFFRS